jgi:hypothetical protein
MKEYTKKERRDIMDLVDGPLDEEDEARIEKRKIPYLREVACAIFTDLRDAHFLVCGDEEEEIVAGVRLIEENLDGLTLPAKKAST